MKFILSALGLFLASAGLSLVTVTPAEASCKFPSRIECETRDDNIPLPTPAPPENCKFPSYAECKPPKTFPSQDQSVPGEIGTAIEEEATPTPAPVKAKKHKKVRRGFSYLKR